MLKDLGELPEARDLLRAALASDQRSFEAGHPSIALRQSNLALVLQDLGELPEARELMIQAYGSLQAKLGDDHSQTKVVRRNLESIEREIQRPRT